MNAAATRQARANAALYEAYAPAVAAGHIAVDYTLPVGVTVDAAPCACLDEECFFCVAVLDAMWQESYEAEMDEWAQKHDPTHPLYGL